ncbi:MerR family transcriptional regulator [Lichenicoccus sp.]|uniref:MerR family transcriptional regulator n=1 Tax=Lichenicoccus sp. TaxID=2781899 RepID=UPI003D0E6B95
MMSDEAELAFERAGRPKKSAGAFRTISEVADDLHVPQHVLRFWETRFGQVKPLKRGGGRRYYRPDDVVLLRRIADLLYTQGYTIKGVQRLLLEGDGAMEGDGALADLPEDEPEPPAVEPEPVRPPPRADPARERDALRQVLIETLQTLERIRDMLPL